MTQAEQMRRVMMLIETQQIDEIGRIGRTIGAAALGLSALAGSGGMASAQDVEMGYSKDRAQQKAVADFQKYHHRMPGQTP